MSRDARYDEAAEWYDANLSGNSPLAALPRETALRLLEMEDEERSLAAGSPET